MNKRSQNLGAVSAIVLLLCLSLRLTLAQTQPLETATYQVLETLPVIGVTRPSTSRTWVFAWSPDGSMGALTDEKTVYLYNSDLQEIGQLNGHTDLVTAVDWNPQGNELVTASADKTIRIWNVQTGENFGETKEILNGHDNWVLNVRYSPDGSKLASLALDESLPPTNSGAFYNTTWIWDAASKQVEITLPSYAGFPTLDWSPDSSLLANSGFGVEEGDTVRVWNIDQGGEKIFSSSLSGDSPIYDVKFSPDGRYSAVGAELTGVVIFNLGAQDLQWFLSGDMQGITAVSWSPDGSKLAAADRYGSLSIWDVATTQKLVYIPNAHTGWVGELDWASSGTKLASLGSEDNTLRVWDVSLLPELTGVPTVTPAFATATPTSTPAS